MPRTAKTLSKLTYPERDYRLALKVLRALGSHKHLTTQGVATVLGNKAPYSHRVVKTALERLEAQGFCQSSGKENAYWWSLSNLGKILLLIFEKKKTLIEFVSRNNDNQLFKMINILFGIGRKNDVEMLIERLAHAERNLGDLYKISVEWYLKVRESILDIDIKKFEYEDLKNYKQELFFEKTSQEIMIAKGKEGQFRLF